MLKNSENAAVYQYIPNVETLEIAGVPYAWNINLIMEVDGSARIFGWALPFDGKIRNTQIIVNGKSRGRIKLAENSEVQRIYPWWPNARMSEFVLEIERTEFDLMAEDEIVVTPRSLLDEETGPSKRSFYFSPRDLQSEFPDEVVRGRIGTSSAFQFSLTGLTLARQFARVFEGASGRPWSSNAVIVDWGCGSGRVARHFIRGLAPNQTFIGLDIDGPAIDWANEHIGRMFWQSPIDPPLALEDGSVDVLYAYSVFTHLTLPHVRNWIREMARVIKKDGYFIFTILSDTAVVALMPYADAGIIGHFKSDQGFDTIANSQLESINVSGDYYRNVWFTKSLIQSALARYFEVELIEENFHYYQDVVVCRRK
jgi:SAM-dependent methyltransferase